LGLATDIRIGTASWTDPGFVEDWYPPKLPASARLVWYAEHFNYVEINATFYALPQARTVERWCTETPDDFLFDVKLPKILSRHSMQTKFLPPDLRERVPNRNGVAQLTPESEDLVVKRTLRELKPLMDAGKFGAFLLQLSPSFRPKTHPLTELDSLVNLLAPHLVAVELRNRDWVVGEELTATVDYLKSRKLSFVLVDAPESEHFTVMPGLTCVTSSELGYFRLHGKNEEGYVKGRTVADRFNHEYSDPELRQIAERMLEIEPQVKRLHAAANNNRSNYAPKAALRLKALLEEREELRKKLAMPARAKKPVQGKLL
jgi:uncharacterized protein YecE (DUF72 family)